MKTPACFFPLHPLLLMILMLTALFADIAVAENAVVENTIAEAASSGTVTVQVEGVKGKLLANVLGYLEVHQFHKKPSPSKARLRYLHRSGEAQIEKALRPFGFYHATVQSSLNQQDGVWLAKYVIDAGEPVLVSEVNLKVSGEGETDPEFVKALQTARQKLLPGKPVDQVAYEELKKKLQVLASQRGYFDVHFEQHEIRIDLPKNSATVNLHYETGKRYKLGAVTFNQGTEWIWDELLNRYSQIESGQFYDARDLQQLQGDLSNSEYYSEVEIKASPESASDDVIPIEVGLKPRKPRKYIFGIGYGTDTGVRGKLGITGRRVNRRGHHYNAEILVSQIKYGIAGEYIIPGKDPRNDAWGLRSSYEEEHSDNRDYEAFNLGGYFRYRDGLWVKTYALDYRVERFEITGENPTSTLLIPSVEWNRTNPPELEKRIYAKNGTWLQMRLRGGVDALLSDTNFLQSQISAKWIYSFAHKGRIITRGSLGTTWVDDFSKLPTSLRFYSGGDTTVRGYRFSSISPDDLNGDVVGGRHLSEASIEYEYPIKEKWSLALFADVGDAFDNNPQYKTGVGFGVHWLSPIGPVRVDFGQGLDDIANNVRLHLTIGPDL